MTLQAENALIFNTTAAKRATLSKEIDVARYAGFTGIETTAAKVLSYLDADHSVSDLKAALGGLPIYGIGTVLNIERHGGDARSLISDARSIFELAHHVGAGGVQVITGPLDYREVVRFREGKPKAGYRGVLDYEEEDRIEITAGNLKMLAEIAQEFDLIVYLEALAWSPVNSLAHQVALLRKASQDNLKMVVDYWHCYASGDHPEDVARIDGDLIYGVHVCDSLPLAGGVPNESVLRDIPTGEGVLDLKAWTDAVKATGYAGWWCSETFCRKLQQENSYDVASQMRAQLASLISS
ncbi:sugar phosphate isomerase/epimerase [Mesorhizobium sp. AR10]|uniref:sugar phosphate isomerase/epimerase family protein n=1 Tax=Mesorhizobium sp. AR10 TaxID=2865839 RepID=UPI00216069B5|nr:sugar phosphate isomerase/epimerase family protein [Mesorhizobium sp. AR10]UVK41167.1 sugar phosphate isomerase/epimerase [Mesorhizobium sp. AR10]